MTPIAEIGTAISLGSEAVKAVKDAKEIIEKLLKEGEELTKSDAKYYSTYIKVAAAAVRGLLNQYISILLEAKKCDIGNVTQQKLLINRIDDYINGEFFRPRLRESITHLQEGREALQEHAEKFLLIFDPKKKEGREAALAEFDNLTNELTGYLGSLGDYTGQSAEALEDLKKVRSDLSSHSLSQSAFVKRIEKLLATLDKSKLMSITDNSAKVIEKLRTSFR